MGVLGRLLGCSSWSRSGCASRPSTARVRRRRHRRRDPAGQREPDADPDAPRGRRAAGADRPARGLGDHRAAASPAASPSTTSSSRPPGRPRRAPPRSRRRSRSPSRRTLTLVQNNGFLLEGNVDGQRGADHERLHRGDLVGRHDAQRVDLSGARPPRGRQLSGPCRLNGLLFDPYPAGFNDVVVSATNCRGTGSSAPRRVYWRPLSPSTRFRQLGQIEVTQSVQTPLDSVPLVAASPNGVKRTFARVYLTAEGTSQRIDEVSGSLTAVRPDGSRPPGPLRAFSVPAPFKPSIAPGTLEQQRSSLVNSLLFELPPEWLGAGPLHLELEHIYIDGVESTFPCDDCENRGPLGQPPGQLGPSTIRFHDTPPVRLWLVSMPYKLKPSDTIPIVPAQLEIDGVASLIRRMYPSADVQVTQMVMPTADTPPTTCKEARGRVQDWAATIGTQDPQTRYLGLLEGDPRGQPSRTATATKVGGCAQRPGHFGWVYAEDELRGCPRARAHVRPQARHGLRAVRGVRRPTGPSPIPSGLIGSATLGDAQGFDAGDPSRRRRPRTCSIGATAIADVMTYCDRQWISDYNYGTDPRQSLRGGPRELPRLPSVHRAFAGAADAARLKVAQQGEARAAAAGPRHRLGEGARRRSTPSPCSTACGPTPSPKARQGRRSSSAAPVDECSRARRSRTLEVGEDSARSIDAVDPVQARDADGSRLSSSGRTLDSARVSKHAPTVRVAEAEAGQAAQASEVKVRWRRARRRRWAASPPRVLYAADGKHYAPVANDLRRRSRARRSQRARRRASCRAARRRLRRRAHGQRRFEAPPGPGQAPAGLDRDPGERSRADGG